MRSARGVTGVQQVCLQVCQRCVTVSVECLRGVCGVSVECLWCVSGASLVRCGVSLVCLTCVYGASAGGLMTRFTSPQQFFEG